MSSSKDVTLSHQPRFAEIQEKWNAYWAGDVLDRPLVVAHVPKSGEYVNYCAENYYHLIHNDVDAWMAAVDRMLDATWYMAEAVPFFRPDLGPDMLGAFLGCDIKVSEDSKSTTWVDHIVDDDEWEEHLPITFDPNNKWFVQHQALCKKIREHAADRYLIGMPDMHSNLDWLSALRGSTGLCTDVLEYDDEIEEAMQQVRELYPLIHDAITKACGISSENGGYIGWIPFWSETSYNIVQCDALAMMGPEQYKRFVHPALEEECQFLDHSIFHLDGVTALHHLDSILSISSLDAIQWVPGAGQKPSSEWIEVLQKIQAAGKKLQVWDLTCEQAKEVSKHLNPEGIVYCVQDMVSREEVDDLCAYLERTT